ncbi:MAG: tetratricopeptide repeat protein [Elusimicrobiota bacterium]|nr:MAG: tetratricopeptide repeat protein [Elusimicrobiota bacterium]
MIRQARAAASPGDADAWTFLGRLSLDAGDNERAAAELSRALALDPRRARARTWLGLALLRSGRPGEGLDALRRAGGGAWARAHRGQALASAGDAAGALREFGRAAASSLSGWPLLWSSRVRLAHGDARGAVRDARAALARETRSAEMYDQLSLSLLGAGERASSLAAFAEAAALDPSLRWRAGGGGASLEPRLAAVAWALGDRSVEPRLRALRDGGA